jgi:AcrR family transcriptional regulator
MTEKTGDCSWLASWYKACQPPERVERRDARKNRQQILAVAQRLFAEQGVDAVSMHQIAVAAGIGQGTLYRRYRHKGELCMDLLQESQQQFVEEVRDFFSATETAPALDQLKGVLARIIAFLEAQGSLLSPIARPECWMQWEGVDFPRHFPAHPSFFTWLHEVCMGLLHEAIERDELPPFDVSYTADALLLNLHPSFYRLQRQEQGFSPERILQGLCRIYIDGLRTQNHDAEYSA